MLQIYADGQPLYYPLHETMTVTAPRLTLERGKAGSFQFGLPPTHDFFDSLKKLKTTITVEFDGVEIFRGRVLSEEKDFYNIRTVYCEGDLAYLVDSVQKGEKYTGTTHALFRKIVAAHNARIEKEKQFEVGEIEVEDREIVLSGQSSQVTDEDSDSFDYKQIAINSITNQWKTSYDYIETCLIEPCGGYLRTRRENGKTYLDWLDDTGTNVEQTLNSKVTTINSKITTIAGKLEAAEANIGSLQADMANIDTLISNKITASRADLSYLKTKGLTVNNLYANNYVSSPAIRMGGATVATQTWVKTQLADYAKSDHTHGWSDITGKPTSFAPTKHRHSFSFTKSLANGHTHKVKINGVTYTSQGVSTNTTHSIDVSGYTGYAGS